jgi:hypothetical protein
MPHTRISLEGIRNITKISVMFVGSLVNIQTQDLPDTKQEW